MSYYPQQLTNDFRYNYAQFWNSILKADLEGIKQSADCLGVGKLYGLFACMVTGRSWGSIQKGIDKEHFRELKEILAGKDYNIQYVSYLSRDMYSANLVIKTSSIVSDFNDSLGTRHIPVLPHALLLCCLFC